MQPKIRVGVVDDHLPYRDSVVFVLESEPDIEVVGQGETAADAFRIARDTAPDVLLLDVNMPGGGLNALARIAPRCPSTRVLIFTVVDDEDEVRIALRRGAQGYLLKGSSGSELVRVVRLVNMGQEYISPGLDAHLVSG